MSEKKKKILIADGDEMEKELFVLMLSKLGYDVESADDGQDALSKTQKTVPDLLILDMVLPKLSGWEVLKKIKADKTTGHIPVIVLSAIDDVKEEVDALDLGVEDYIRKPFNFSVVIARIRRRVSAGVVG